jgi:GntR family transcriptional regulator, transcriptional repressor for pyruvate dehydrogenase complex
MSSRFKNIAVSAVQNCVAALREEIFRLESDEFLGSEDTLTRELGVSTPTLRQAARLLEQEQLLTIKRGITGGYYTRRPNAQAVAHMSAIFLRAHNSSVAEAYEVTLPLVDLALRLACGCTDKKLRAEMERLLASDTETLSHEQNWTLDNAFSDLLARMTGNVVLLLMLSIFNDYGALLAAMSRDSGSAIPKEYFATRPKIIAAILAGNERVAARHMQARMQIAYKALNRSAGAQRSKTPARKSTTTRPKHRAKR